MGQTRKNYPDVWLVLSLEAGGSLASGHERKEVGDIIAIMPGTHKGVGMLEMKGYLWIKCGGFEEEDLSRLGESVEGFEKRRFGISLADLQTLNPRFDPASALDPDVIHQPFAVVDEESGQFLADGKVYELSGLVRDKLTRRYL